jgi:hypothetical protein
VVLCRSSVGPGGNGVLIFDHRGAEVGLQVADGLIDLLAEGDAIELVEHVL